MPLTLEVTFSGLSLVDTSAAKVYLCKAGSGNFEHVSMLVMRFKNLADFNLDRLELFTDATGELLAVYKICLGSTISFECQSEINQLSIETEKKVSNEDDTYLSFEYIPSLAKCGAECSKAKPEKASSAVIDLEKRGHFSCSKVARLAEDGVTPAMWQFGDATDDANDQPIAEHPVWTLKSNKSDHVIIQKDGIDLFQLKKARALGDQIPIAISNLEKAPQAPGSLQIDDFTYLLDSYTNYSTKKLPKSPKPIVTGGSVICPSGKLP